MGDWFRSITVLAVAFAAAVVVTIGLATVIVPGRAAGPEAAGGDDGSGPAAPSPTPIEGIGGHLTVTGDRSGTLTVTSESNDDRYSLEGSGARIVFEGRPPVIAQVSWDGLEFFPEPDDCTLTPGELNSEIGVGYAQIACENLTDIRGGGTVSLSGTLGLALTMVGESDLPDMGGSASVGDETWTFDEAILFTFPINLTQGGEDYNMILSDEGTNTGCPDNAPASPECSRTSLRFRYDVQTHRLALVEVARDGTSADLAPGACSLATEELGRLSPGAAVVELTIDCPAADVPGLGAVPITGTVIIQQLEFIP
jgi:hypothetical protein